MVYKKKPNKTITEEAMIHIQIYFAPADENSERKNE